MSLLKDVKSFNPNAASVLEEVGLRSNVEIQSLTREDLNDLFPGRENFKLRREVFDIICKQKPVDALVKELKGFIPSEYFRAGLTNNGVLVDYLHNLKDMKTGVNKVQDFLDSHIGLLEEFSKENQESDKGILSKPPAVRSTHLSSTMMKVLHIGKDRCGEWFNKLVSEHLRNIMPSQIVDWWFGGACSSDTSGSGAIQNDQTDDSRGRGSPFTEVLPLDSEEYDFGAVTSKSNHTDEVPQRSRVIYRNLVRGKTFGAHLTLMDKVKNQDNDEVQFDESNEDHQITVVFCPITSRIGSDVDAAMSDFKDDKPVILVLMFHTTETSHTPTRKTWSCEANIVLHVNVFYHETKYGLLNCCQNDAAVSKIRKQLLEIRTPRFQDTRENAMDLGDNSGTVTM